MKLVYCIHSLHNCGGTERVLSLKANYFAAREGYEVHIVTAHLRGRRIPFELNPQIILHDLGASDSAVLGWKKYLRALDKALNAIQPDITIAVNGKALFALPHCTDGSIKMSEFHFSHEKYMMEYGRGPIGRRYAGLRTARLEKAAAKLDAFVVLTKEDLESWKGKVPGVRQIYNPADCSAPESSECSSKVMMAAGRLAYQKNYPDMLKAWSLVERKHPDWTLKIYGNGPERRKMQKAVASGFPGGNVILMGTTSNMAAAFLDCSGLVLSSRFEGFPMVLLEASSYGVPMVSYNCPKGPSEIIVDGVNGYLAQNSSPEDLADKICRLIEDEAGRKEKGRSAKELAGRFGTEAIMAQWEKLFNELKFKA